MPVTPTGPLSLPLSYLRESVAASATFMSVCGVATAALAKEFIYIGERPAHEPIEPTLEIPEETYWPFCLIDVAKWAVVKIDTTGWSEPAALSLSFEFATTAAYSTEAARQDARLDFYNKMGAIVQEIMALAMTGNYLACNRIDLRATGRGDPDEMRGRKYHAAEFLVWMNGQGNA